MLDRAIDAIERDWSYSGALIEQMRREDVAKLLRWALEPDYAVLEREEIVG